jgi:hypothetical protein
MYKVVAILAVAANLAACDAISTVTEGYKYAKNVEGDLQSSTGVKPRVGFRWHNGRLQYVRVVFPRLIETKSLEELAAAVRVAVGREFKQNPDNIVLAFSLGKGAANTTAELDDVP